MLDTRLLSTGEIWRQQGQKSDLKVAGGFHRLPHAQSGQPHDDVGCESRATR